MEDKVFQLLYDYLNDRYRTTNINDMFIVWSCHILGNRKYLIEIKYSSDYFEITYDVNKKKMVY